MLKNYNSSQKKKCCKNLWREYNEISIPIKCEFLQEIYCYIFLFVDIFRYNKNVKTIIDFFYPLLGNDKIHFRLFEKISYKELLHPSLSIFSCKSLVYMWICRYYTFSCIGNVKTVITHFGGWFFPHRSFPRRYFPYNFTLLALFPASLFPARSFPRRFFRLD